MESESTWTSGLYPQLRLVGFTNGSVRFYINNGKKPLRKWLIEDNRNKDEELVRFTAGDSEAYKVIVDNQYEYKAFSYLQYENIVYEVAVSDHVSRVNELRPYAEKIVESFRFTDPPVPSSTEADPPNWEVYNDKVLALSFRYPQTWKVVSLESEGEYDSAISDTDHPALGGRMFMSTRNASYDEFRKSYEGELPSLVTDSINETTIADKPAVAADIMIGQKKVGACLFMSDQLYRRFYLCYDSNDPIQRAIVQSLTFYNTDSSTAEITLEEITLYVAQKEGNDVTVKRINVASKEEKTIFAYKESTAVSTEGNTWQGLPPSIALSHDGKRVVYSSENGLIIRDLVSGRVTPLFQKTGNPPPETDQPPTWSNDRLQYIHVISNPQWSADDNYISFNGGFSEGATTRLIDVASKKIISLEPAEVSPFGTSLSISWSSTGHDYVIPNGRGYQQPGLFIGTAENLSAPVDYSPYVEKDADYFSAGFSTEGRNIVGLRGIEGSTETENTIFILDTVRKKSFDVTKVKGTQEPFFSEDGQAIYYYRPDTNSLIQYDVQTMKIEKETTLPAQFNRWEKIEISPEGYLVLWASVFNIYSGGSNTNRLFIINPDDSQIIYSSKLFKGFTNFLGFEK